MGWFSGRSWPGVLMALALGFGAGAQAQPTPDGDDSAARVVPSAAGDVMFSFAPLVREASPAVVNIFTKSLVGGGRVDDFFNGPLGDTRRRRDQMLGSGVIVTDDGKIVTNAHVIADSDEIEVFLTNGDILFADILFEDERTDIAVLQLRAEAEGMVFPVLPIGDSDAVQVGDFVLAIGNPFGVGQSTSMGIVSAVNRTDVDIIDTGAFIQTDAAINPGNSGGALIDINGQLIGINSAILSRSGGSAGIGWAIPSNFVRSTLNALELGGGSFIRPWIGFSGESLTRQVAAALGLSRRNGVLVERVASGSPAQSVGLREGDVIVAVDGREVDSNDALKFAFASKMVGDEVTLAILSGGEEPSELRYTLIAPPEDPPRNTTTLSGRHPLEGATIVNVSPAVAEEYGLGTVMAGVLVTEIPADSIAGRLSRIREGDVIITMQGERVGRVEDVVRLSQQRTRRWSFELDRDGRFVSFRATF